MERNVKDAYFLEKRKFIKNICRNTPLLIILFFLNRESNIIQTDCWNNSAVCGSCALKLFSIVNDEGRKLEDFEAWPENKFARDTLSKAANQKPIIGANEETARIAAGPSSRRILSSTFVAHVISAAEPIKTIKKKRNNEDGDCDPTKFDDMKGNLISDSTPSSTTIESSALSKDHSYLLSTTTTSSSVKSKNPPISNDDESKNNPSPYRKVSSGKNRTSSVEEISHLSEKIKQLCSPPNKSSSLLEERKVGHDVGPIPFPEFGAEETLVTIKKDPANKKEKDDKTKEEKELAPLPPRCRCFHEHCLWTKQSPSQVEQELMSRSTFVNCQGTYTDFTCESPINSYCIKISKNNLCITCRKLNEIQIKKEFPDDVPPASTTKFAGETIEVINLVDLHPTPPPEKVDEQWLKVGMMSLLPPPPPPDDGNVDIDSLVDAEDKAILDEYTGTIQEIVSKAAVQLSSSLAEVREEEEEEIVVDTPFSAKESISSLTKATTEDTISVSEKMESFVQQYNNSISNNTNANVQNHLEIENEKNPVDIPPKDHSDEEEDDIENDDDVDEVS